MNRWKPVHWLEMITFFFFLGTQIYGFPERTGHREAKSHLRFYSENVIGLLSKKKKYPLALTTFARSIAFGKNLYKMPVTSHAAVSVSAYLFLHLNFTAIRKYLYLGQKPCQRKLDKSHPPDKTWPHSVPVWGSYSYSGRQIDSGAAKLYGLWDGKSLLLRLISRPRG